MAEDFSLSELVVPGTYIRVRAEGLISVGGIAAGNVGIVGTARRMENNANVLDYNRTYVLSDYDSAVAALGGYDKFEDGSKKLNLTRGIQILFRNGATTVYARPLNLGANDAAPGQTDFENAFKELLKENVNILVAPELSTTTALAVLPSILETAEGQGKDLIAVVGSDADTAANVIGQVNANDRLILTTPSIVAFDSALTRNVTLPGTYGAAAVAGLLSSLTPHSSPTNKVLSGVTELGKRYSYGETKDLISGGVVVLEQRNGVRVVRGVTTEMKTNGPFKQITTRRITNFAKDGIRQAANPFIGRLNNVRVRKALQGAIDGFLTTMVQDEALTEYDLNVTATRQDEIAGRAIVNVVIKPTFSIDFVAVTLVLE